MASGWKRKCENVYAMVYDQNKHGNYSKRTDVELSSLKSRKNENIDGSHNKLIKYGGTAYEKETLNVLNNIWKEDILPNE
jgi:hypothetical protein